MDLLITNIHDIATLLISKKNLTPHQDSTKLNFSELAQF